MDFKYKSSEIALLLGIDSNILEYEPIVSKENNVFVVTIYIINVIINVPVVFK